MIYKIVGDFNEDLDKILKHFQSNYVIMFFRNVIYLADIKEGKAKKDMKSFVAEVIKSDFYLQEINEYNLKYEPPQVVEWCKEQFIRLDTVRFEAKQQEELKAMLDFIRAIEDNLKTMTQE